MKSKSILRNPTRKETHNAHGRACVAAGMPAEDQETLGSGDSAERDIDELKYAERIKSEVVAVAEMVK